MTKRERKFRRILSLLLLAGLILTMAPPVGAAALTTSVVVTSNLAGDSNETWTVTVTNTGAIPAAAGNNHLVITLPGQNLGSVLPGDVTVVDGLTGVGAATIDNGVAKTVSIPFTGALSAGSIVMVTIAKVTNGAAGTVTVATATDDDGVGVDSGTDDITLVETGHTQQAVVGQAAEVSITGGTSFTYTVDPSGKTNETHNNVITVLTNAKGGYVLQTKVNQQLTHSVEGTETIPAYTGTNAVPTDWSGNTPAGFGYNVSGANKPAAFSTADHYAGFTLGGDTVMSANDATGNVAHTVTMTYKIVTDWGIDAGTYNNTVTYVFTPSF